MKKMLFYTCLIAILYSFTVAIKPVLEGKENKTKAELVDGIYNGTGVQGDLTAYQQKTVDVIAIQGKNQGWYDKVPASVRQEAFDKIIENAYLTRIEGNFVSFGIDASGNFVSIRRNNYDGEMFLVFDPAVVFPDYVSEHSEVIVCSAVCGNPIYGLKITSNAKVKTQDDPIYNDPPVEQQAAVTSIPSEPAQVVSQTNITNNYYNWKRTYQPYRLSYYHTREGYYSSPGYYCSSCCWTYQNYWDDPCYSQNQYQSSGFSIGVNFNIGFDYGYGSGGCGFPSYNSGSGGYGGCGMSGGGNNYFNQNNYYDNSITNTSTTTNNINTWNYGHHHHFHHTNGSTGYPVDNGSNGEVATAGNMGYPVDNGSNGDLHKMSNTTASNSGERSDYYGQRKSVENNSAKSAVPVQNYTVGYKQPEKVREYNQSVAYAQQVNQRQNEVKQQQVNRTQPVSSSANAHAKPAYRTSSIKLVENGAQTQQHRMTPSQPQQTGRQQQANRYQPASTHQQNTGRNGNANAMRVERNQPAVTNPQQGRQQVQRQSAPQRAPQAQSRMQSAPRQNSVARQQQVNSQQRSQPIQRQVQSQPSRQPQAHQQVQRQPAPQRAPQAQSRMQSAPRHNSVAQRSSGGGGRQIAHNGGRGR